MFPQLVNATCLALEAHQVILIRMTQLYDHGLLNACEEVGLMMSEKVDAACSAATSLASGRSPDDVVTAYRDIVQANLKRLSA